MFDIFKLNLSKFANTDFLNGFLLSKDYHKLLGQLELLKDSNLISLNVFNYYDDYLDQLFFKKSHSIK